MISIRREDEAYLIARGFTPAAPMSAGDASLATTGNGAVVLSNGAAITGIANPQSPGDVANKAYVDSTSGGITDAPLDGNTYARSSGAWAQIAPAGDAATIEYVDAKDAAMQASIDNLSQNLVFIGQTNVPSDSTNFTPASGVTPSTGPIPLPTAQNKGHYVIVVTAGNPPVGSNIPAGSYAKSDWIVSDGTTWTQLQLGRTSVTASEVGVVPTIAGFADTQSVLQHLYESDPPASSTTPLMNGLAAVGIAPSFARGDHVHPTDTNLYPTSNPANYVDAAGAALASPVKSVATKTGAITLVHGDISDWSTFVPIASSTMPLVNGTAAIGTSGTFARSDHVHPVDTSRYAASNPSGFQTAAQVTAALPVASSTNPSMAGAVAVGTGTTWARADHVHPVDTSRAPAMGITNGSNATAGQIGEYIVSANQVGFALTSAIALTIATINLTPGCYEAWGLVDYSLDASKAPSMIAAAISSVNNALPTDTAMYTGIGNMTMLNLTGLTAGARQVLMTGQCRVNTSTALTLYVVANAIWSSGGTLLTKGYICARRVR
jgi:hypothetical protein